MVLFILAVIVLLAVLAAVATAAAGCILVERSWHWLRPMAVLGLVLLVSLGIIDAMAGNNAARSAEETRKAQTEKDLFGESDEVAARQRPIQLEPDAPAWTKRPPREMLSTARNEIELTVHAGPHLGRADCEAELAKKLSETVDDYLRSEFASRMPVKVNVPQEYIRQHVVKDTYVSVSKRTVASNIEPQEMVDMYALVKFDPDNRKELQKLWRDSIVQSRMKTAAAGLAGVLGLLTLGWAVLRRPAKAA